MFVPTSSPAQLLSLCKYQFWSLLRYPFWYFWVCLMDFSTQMPCQNFYLIRSKTNLLTLQINKFSFFTLLFEHPLLRNSKLCLSPLSFFAFTYWMSCWVLWILFSNITFSHFPSFHLHWIIVFTLIDFTSINDYTLLVFSNRWILDSSVSLTALKHRYECSFTFPCFS